MRPVRALPIMSSPSLRGLEADLHLDAVLRVGVVLEALETSLRSGGNGRDREVSQRQPGVRRIGYLRPEMDPAAVRLDLEVVPDEVVAEGETVLDDVVARDLPVGIDLRVAQGHLEALRRDHVTELPVPARGVDARGGGGVHLLVRHVEVLAR